jgi:hypothetical protein
MPTFVPGFDHDVFISYAQVDDIPEFGPKGWVSTFVELLIHRLARVIGRSDNFDVWMDRNRLGAELPVDANIAGSLKKTAILVSFLSNGYFASPWCSKEREAFLKAANPLSSRVSRLFVVELDQIEDGQRPKEFSDCLAYRFWAKEAIDKFPRRLGERNPADDDEYLMKIDALARELRIALERLAEEGASTLAAPDVSVAFHPVALSQIKGSPPPFTVFLAEPTDDLDGMWWRLREYLVQQNIRVLPEQYLPRSPGEFEMAVKEGLTAVDLFVQLLSQVSGRRVNENETHVSLQNRCAIDAGIPVLQWRDPSLAARDTRRFRVALTFPGDRRPLVARIADSLSAKIGRNRVFYDDYYKAELARLNLDTYLQDVFRKESDLVVVFIAAGYEHKEWCGLEWRAVRDLIKKSGNAQIMLFRIDDTDISGVFSIDGFVDAEKQAPEDIATLIIQRLESDDRGNRKDRQAGSARGQLANSENDGVAYDRLLYGPQVQAVEVEEFKREVVRTLERLREQNRRRQAREKKKKELDKNGGFTKSIFVLANPQDGKVAKRIFEVVDGQGFGCMLPIELDTGGVNSTPEQIRRDFEDNVLLAHGTVVIQDKSPSTWVRSQLTEVEKMKYQRSNERGELGVYLEPPPKEFFFKLPHLHVLRGWDGDDEIVFQPFLDAIAKGVSQGAQK